MYVQQHPIRLVWLVIGMPFARRDHGYDEHLKKGRWKKKRKKYCDTQKAHCVHDSSRAKELIHDAKRAFDAHSTNVRNNLHQKDDDNDDPYSFFGVMEQPLLLWHHGSCDHVIITIFPFHSNACTKPNPRIS